jgi:hypothetical protein
MHAKLLGATLTALAVVALGGTPVRAQWGDPRGGHDEGYRDGARAGGEDARDGRTFEYQRHRDYRDGDRGYQSRSGRRDDYTQQYRDGFVAGYRDGYYSGGGRGARRGPTGGRPVPPFDSRPGYGSGPGNRSRGGYGRAPVVDIAHGNGFEDGYQRGLDDGRDRDRPDPWRHSRYRNADQGYRRDYGPRSVYQQAYRAAFEQGYEQGYRDSRGSRRRGGIWN